jgi:hypothetical protein
MFKEKITFTKKQSISVYDSADPNDPTILPIIRTGCQYSRPPSRAELFLQDVLRHLHRRLDRQ